MGKKLLIVESPAKAKTIGKYLGGDFSVKSSVGHIRVLPNEGGAIKIKERYVDSRRHTRYLQKFSVLAEAGAFRWKQYMQNIAAPLVESRVTSRAYRTTDRLDAPHRFLIPVYRDMPSAPSPDPAGGNSVFSPTRRRFWYNFLR